MLIPYSRFSKQSETNVTDFAVGVFSQTFVFGNDILHGFVLFLFLFEILLQILSQNKMVSRAMDIFTRSENHEHGDVLGFGKWQGKVISPICSRIILRSFWAIQSLKNRVKVAPQTPAEPESEFVPYPL